jgi:hypothetical protein
MSLAVFGALHAWRDHLRRGLPSQYRYTFMALNKLVCSRWVVVALATAGIGPGLAAGGCANDAAKGTGGSAGSAGGSGGGGNTGSGGGSGGTGAVSANGGRRTGASGGGAGTMTTGGTPGGGAGGSAGAAGAGLPQSAIIVQDRFDAATANGPPDVNKWASYPIGQEALAPVVDTARFHTAPHAARVTSISSGLGSFLVPLAGLPAPGNAFYVRVFINWAKATSMITGHSGFLVGAVARENNGTELRLGISSKGPGGVPRMDLNLQNPSDGGGGETTRYSNGFTDGGNPADFPGVGFQFAANTWTCVEALFKGTPSAAEFQVWIDDVEIPQMHVTDFRGSATAAPRTNWAPTYNFLKIGAQDYDANLGQIWYDDVVVAAQPIGCGYQVP